MDGPLRHGAWGCASEATGLGSSAKAVELEVCLALLDPRKNDWVRAHPPHERVGIPAPLSELEQTDTNTQAKLLRGDLALNGRDRTVDGVERCAVAVIVGLHNQPISARIVEPSVALDVGVEHRCPCDAQGRRGQ